MGRTEQNGYHVPLRIAGRYRLVEKLGTGGMSEVWRGFDETLGRSVAVKVLSRGLAAASASRDRLRQEALSAARLCHPHITGIFDFGEATLDGRVTVPFVVMELNDGESVSARLAREGPLPWREAVTIVAEVASALATAHARGVVHRDVTPANVMLTGAGAKVVDFGISAIVGQRDAAPDGSLLGTPAYLAPERLAGAQVTAATDVYALGLLLYRTLTARLPWPAETTAEALRAHLYADPEPLPTLPGLPETVAELCLRCLSKAPADRPAAADVSRALAAEAGFQPIIPPIAPRYAPRGTVRAVAPALVESTVPAGQGSLGRALLRYLGLPGGLRLPAGDGPSEGSQVGAGARRLWLRAGLRLGPALRLRPARPLGGGLFSGGGLRGGGLTGGFLRGRHRVQVAVVTTAVLAVAGLAWSAEREPPEVEQAQAAGAGPVAAGPAAGVRCAVRYQLKRDSGTTYEALLTVATTHHTAQAPWRVQFSYPGKQRLTGTPRAVTQTGRRVTAKGKGKLQTFTLRGEYTGYNPLPLSFTMDGNRCRAEVLSGLVVDPAAERRQPSRQGAGSKRSGSSHGVRPPRETVSPSPRVRPSVPPTPPPFTRGENGFSLAL